ncbi:SAPS-domain-containing protein [Violaceomyces palustris]|uniref:SAPS-domain-containing protein n=1 Tax=Violaceomyces palustris TaxID=1673888 RepID=A0ACD0P4J6_9BASI|nr:SAPS-domain-containing protein [Violaceomyces palustris]
MFWRFGFSHTSTLDTLLEKPNVTLEEVLDEDDLLQECKSQNPKLVEYLSQPRVLKRLLEHVVGTAQVGGTGGKDWEEKVKFKYPYMASEVLSCEIWAIVEGILNDTEGLLEPFWNAVLNARPTPSQAPLPHHSHPLFAETTSSPPSRLGIASIGDGQGGESRPSLDSDSGNESGPRATSALENGPGRSVLAGYWAKVNGVFLDKKPLQMINFIQGLPSIVERFVAHLETPAVVDLLFRIIQCEESIKSTSVIDWLSERDLIPKVVDLLAPNHSVDLHNTVSELLKAIIALSAPSPASLNQGQDGMGGDAYGGQSVGGVNNRLVRELASERVVRKMVGFMLDSQHPHQLARRLTDAADEQLARITLEGGPKSRRTSMLRTDSSGLKALAEDPQPGDESALDDDDEENFPRPLNPREFPASEIRHSGAHDHRDSTATIRPGSFFPPVSAPTVAVTRETSTSSLVTCISVFIELIRKNNSDYFEQHLFHTLRTHLLQRQQEISERRARRGDTSTDSENNGEDKKPQVDEEKAENEKSEEDEEMEGMEEAMAEMADRLGIVHLGPMLKVLCERLHDFQALIKRPRNDESMMATTVGNIVPLTFERYRITELYAELLHCSNMALLNRGPGEGPQYSEDGTLLGGIEGLQILARTLQGGDGPDVPESSRPVEHGDTTGDETSMDLVAPENTPQASKADEQPEKEQEGDTKESVESVAGGLSPPGEGHSRAGSGHKREKTSVGDDNIGNVSEDADDEALLNEISLDAASGPAAALDGETDKSESVGASAGKVSEAAEAAIKIDEAPLKAQETEAETERKEDEEDAKSIRSVISGMSLADLTSPHPSGPPSPTDDSREYVVGDLLKKKFLECGIIPSILDLFFDYPWNNFLHNVVYDILQQFFNGRMDFGLNRHLTLSVFNEGRLAERIVEGHRKNEESMAGPRRIRLGYMGHMNLIAEETVKLFERYPYVIRDSIQPPIAQPDWDNFVNEGLRESREREAGPLAGGRPSAGGSMSFGSGVGGADDDDDGDVGQIGLGRDTFASYLSSQMGGPHGGSDDDDSDEESSWISHDLNSGRGSGFDDVFAPADSLKRQASDGDEDEWGPFADPGESNFDFPSSSTVAGGSGTNPFSQNLTPADWSAQFRREGTPDIPMGGDDDDDDEDSSIGSDNEDRSSTSPKDGDTPFVDLLDHSTLRRQDVVAAAHARRPSLTLSETPPASAPGASGGGGRRRASSSSGSSDSASAAQAVDQDKPLGPGVPDDIEQTEDGMLKRTLEDGTVVIVPLDEVALAKESEEAPPSTASGDKEGSQEVDEVIIDN